MKCNFDSSELFALRPLDMSLDNTKARKLLGNDLGSAPEFLASLHQQERAGRSTELLRAVKQTH